MWINTGNRVVMAALLGLAALAISGNAVAASKTSPVVARSKAIYFSLDAAAAKKVVGKRQAKKAAHQVTPPKTSPAPSAGPTPLGLFMGPDPNYPNPDTDTGDPTD
jgi:hypothetical protein